MSVELGTLPNGLRVVSHRMDHLESVTVGLWVGAGSRFEGAREHGLAHLLEHMAFKGTRRRSARDIAEEIESVGGDLNAVTSPEATAYFARVLKPDLPLGLDLLSDIVINPTFDGAELVREKDVIIQEILATNDNPDDVIYDLVHENAFPNQALGRSILGTAESVSALGAEDLLGFRDRRYSARRMVLAAAGALDHADLLKLAGEHFGAVGGFAVADPPPALYRSGLCASPIRFEQGHVVVAYRGPAYSDGDYYAGQMLATILGGGMSSRLFQEAREARGLCYSIYAFCWGLSDTGLFGVHAATAPERYDELLEVVAGEIRRLAEEPVRREELERARAQLKAGLLMSLESTGARAEQLALQTLAFGAPLPIGEVIAKVDAVTMEAVQWAAGKVFDASAPTLACVGPSGLAVDGKGWARKLGLAPGLAAE